ncbi:MAG: alpha-L-glutamate ligase-like protein [Thioalkalivibrionaceae bacterium]
MIRFISPWRLRALGVVGMNQRNGQIIAVHNRRRDYPKVDNKLITKKLAEQAGLTVPQLFDEIRTHHDIHHWPRNIPQGRGFVIKPAHGAGGDGILVIKSQRRDEYIRASGRRITRAAIDDHLSNILSGMYSLGGRPDTALIEYRVDFSDRFADLSWNGVPDIRTVVYQGFPIMAMMRLPTQASDGKANLHQGAVGVGIDIASGATCGGVQYNQPIDLHPDTEQPVAGRKIDDWTPLLRLAAGCHELAGLGYLGVDVVLDEIHGPMILELNARPGLAIQIANRHGLGPRLKTVDRYLRHHPKPTDPAIRVALARQWTAAWNDDREPEHRQLQTDAIEHDVPPPAAKTA